MSMCATSKRRSYCMSPVTAHRCFFSNKDSIGFLNLAVFEQYLRAALCPTSGCLIVLNIPSFSDGYAVRTNQLLTSVVLGRWVDIRVEKSLRLFGMELVWHPSFQRTVLSSSDMHFFVYNRRISHWLHHLLNNCQFSSLPIRSNIGTLLDPRRPELCL